MRQVAYVETSSCVDAVSIKDRNEALIWIVKRQTARRNLTEYEKVLSATRLVPLYKERARLRQAEGGKTKLPLETAEANKGDTRDLIAKDTGVNARHLDFVAKIETQGTPELIQQARSGEISINKAYETIRPPKSRMKPKAEPVHTYVDAGDSPPNRQSRKIARKRY